MNKLSLSFAILLLSASTFYVLPCRADLPTLTVLHSFAPDPHSDPAHFQDLSANAGRPQGPLIQGTDGAFYGITTSGGVHGTGTIFKINGDGAGFTLLHSFDAQEMGINAGNKDGGNPKGALVFGRDSALYGVAESGGPDGVGTVFKVNQDGSGFKVVRAFDPVRHSGDGAYPKGLTLGVDGMLYGITLSGGSRNGNGVLFKMSQDGIDFHILYTFHALFHIYNSEQTGLNPSAGVVTERNGACYGTTSGGGNQGCGDVYKIDTDGNFSVLHSFLKVQGSKDSSMFPQGPLVVGLDNFLYGCTRRGGTDNGGIVYKINTDGSGFEVLHSFSAPGSENGDGTLPDGPLVFGRDGFLYGVTSRGGTGEVGVLFRVSPDGSKFFALHDFSLPNHDLCNADGGLSFMGLTLGRDGNLYGISAGGGANGTGTIFRVSFPAAK